jgi:hypothetical protein
LLQTQLWNYIVWDTSTNCWNRIKWQSNPGRDTFPGGHTEKFNLKWLQVEILCTKKYYAVIHRNLWRV